MPIGGLKEKTMAAYSAGAKTVLIPHDNQRDIEDIDPMARENLQFIPCRKVSEVLSHALLPKKQEAKAAVKEPVAPTTTYIPLTPNQPQGSVRFSETSN